MKLNRSQIAAVRRQTGFKPVPQEAAAQNGLPEAFGDQTFYVDENGLYVFESVEPASGTGEPLLGIRIARVEGPEPNDDEVTLRPVIPQPTDMRVDLAA